MKKENVFLGIATVEAVLIFAAAVKLRKAVEKEIKAKYGCKNLKEYFKQFKSRKI